MRIEKTLLCFMIVLLNASQALSLDLHQAQTLPGIAILKPGTEHWLSCVNPGNVVQAIALKGYVANGERRFDQSYQLTGRSSLDLPLSYLAEGIQTFEVSSSTNSTISCHQFVSRIEAEIVIPQSSALLQSGAGSVNSSTNSFANARNSLSLFNAADHTIVLFVSLTDPVTGTRKTDIRGLRAKESVVWNLQFPADSVRLLTIEHMEGNSDGPFAAELTRY